MTNMSCKRGFSFWVKVTHYVSFADIRTRQFWRVLRKGIELSTFPKLAY